MPPSKTAPPSGEVTPSPASKEKLKRYPGANTNWMAFDNAKLIPTTIICDVIKMHPADEACKSKLILNSQAMLNHYNGEHGGGFQIKVKQGDGKKWPGWEELATAKIEAISLRCEVCDREVDISTRDILNHLRPHQGKFRGAYQNYRDTFFLQIQNTPTIRYEDDDESPTEDTE